MTPLMILTRNQSVKAHVGDSFELLTVIHGVFKGTERCIHIEVEELYRYSLSLDSDEKV